ncbi:MAG: ABC-F family ATP-binding cassette domain-containing protein [Candidatus Diapherotrites archaeon]|uniref:ABC-F family ATP-binding cassette domain-containing protein n=1 Tax=Candidatus Iainarchaeum sp. TaxID=3101447 RepID=A0A8T4LM14_9ARCH|nr:ABC-F family ATP-binding cassette domain-containing protein [Candidatus Diapherotrites archaeon]
MALSIKHLTISIGKHELLLDESVGIVDGSKVGLIGRNGVGKTTFLQAILGQVDYLGSIEFNGKAAYFSQHIDLDPDKTVQQTLGESAPIHHQGDFEEELKAIELQLADPANHQPGNAARLSKLTDRYVELQAKLGEPEKPRSTSKIKSVLRTLEVQESWLEKSIGSLSTGQRAIIALAQILSSGADFLLLDEPTNHLDFKRLEILENYLRAFKGTVLMVTHDRYFLDRVCDTILKIEKGKWTKYRGNYSDYVKTREAAFEAQKTAYRLENKYLAMQRDKIARIGKSPAKVKQGQYRERLLEKREVVEKPDLDQSQFKTRFEASPIHGPVVLELKDLTVGYDKPLISHINLNVGADQRIILIGENGMGKSTLFKTIEGRVPALSGEVILDQEGKLGYADQELKDLSTHATLYDEIYALLKDLGKTRQNLSMMGFVEDAEVFKPISQLSMGEKSRLNLLKVLIEKPNLLLLDEPTNHLDIDAREIIENAFLNYDGAIFAVSHDRYFIHKIAQRVLVVRDGTINELEMKKPG